ncbi:MAG TPA: response regulator [Thermoanaerobaculia bacterium]|jgi:DNA-binding response OmpR family regulator
MKILLVEDNPLIASAIEREGEQNQIRTEHATDGWDAIEKLENDDEYSAIVIDTDLPRQSGFGVLTYLREEIGPRLGNVVVMTSSDRTFDDVVNVIRKTDEISELARAVFMACAVRG